MEQQVKNLQKIMRILDYKVWYYQTAKKAGTTAVPRIKKAPYICLRKEPLLLPAKFFLTV